MVDRADVEAELDAYMSGEAWPEADPEDETRPQPVVDEAAVAGVLRRIRRLSADRAKIQAACETERQLIAAFESDRCAGIDREIAWGSRSLEVWMRQYNRASGKKTVKVSTGEVKLRPDKGRVVVTDLPAFLQWAAGIAPVVDGVEREPAPEPRTPEEQSAYAADVDAAIQTALRDAFAFPDLVRFKVEPVKDALAKLHRGDELTADGTVTVHLATTMGEKIPGVVIEHDELDRFSAVPKGD